MSGDTSACSQAKSLAAVGVEMGVEAALRVQGVLVQRGGGGEVEAEAEGGRGVGGAALSSLARATEASGDAVKDE
jgi:hypothetical protein